MSIGLNSENWEYFDWASWFFMTKTLGEVQELIMKYLDLRMLLDGVIMFDTTQELYEQTINQWADDEYERSLMIQHLESLG